MSFEESLRAIEESVRKLESGELGLAEALEEYEKGIRYLKQCHGLLERAEQKIELLTGVDAEGRPTTRRFDHDAAAGRPDPTVSGRAKKRGAKSPPKSAADGPSEPAEDDADHSHRLF